MISKNTTEKLLKYAIKNLTNFVTLLKVQEDKKKKLWTLKPVLQP